MRVLVTGSNGFIGKNLLVRLDRANSVEIDSFDISSDHRSLNSLLERADAVVHLAGINRPKDSAEFITGNLLLTSNIADYLEKTERALPVIFASSIQAELENDYGRSKKEAEDRLKTYAKITDARVRVFASLTCSGNGASLITIPRLQRFVTI